MQSSKKTADPHRIQPNQMLKQMQSQHPKAGSVWTYPRDIIHNRIGRDNLIIAEYVTEQIFGRIRNNATGFRWKVIQFGLQDASYG